MVKHHRFCFTQPLSSRPPLRASPVRPVLVSLGGPPPHADVGRQIDPDCASIKLKTYPDILWLSWADWDRYASTISNSGRLRESNDDIEGFTNQKKGYLFGEWRSIINDGDSPIVWVCLNVGIFYASLFLQICNFQVPVCWKMPGHKTKLEAACWQLLPRSRPSSPAIAG